MDDFGGTYGIGTLTWPGLAKLIEECGEVIQVLGKLLAAPDLDHTWTAPDGTVRGSGDLTSSLYEELGDLKAALDFFLAINDHVDTERVLDRANEKFSIFCRWHAEGILDRATG